MSPKNWNLLQFVFQITGWFHSLMQVDISSRILPHCGGSYKPNAPWQSLGLWKVIGISVKVLSWSWFVQKNLLEVSTTDMLFFCFSPDKTVFFCFGDVLFATPSGGHFPVASKELCPLAFPSSIPCTRVSARGSTW